MADLAWSVGLTVHNKRQIMTNDRHRDSAQLTIKILHQPAARPVQRRDLINNFIEINVTREDGNLITALL